MRPRCSASGVAATSSATATVPPAVWIRARGPSGPLQAARRVASAVSPAIARGCNHQTRSLIAMLMVTAVVFSLCLAAAMAVFFRQLWRRFNLLQAAQPAALFDRIPERLKAVVVYFFG